jgi:hypothetical protein
MMRYMLVLCFVFVAWPADGQTLIIGGGNSPQDWYAGRNYPRYAPANPRELQRLKRHCEPWRSSCEHMTYPPSRVRKGRP